MENFELDLNFNFTDLNGTPILSSTAGKVLATTLANATQGDSLKYWGWALNLNAGKPISLDKSDKTLLKNFITASEKLPVISKAQILELFN